MDQPLHLEPERKIIMDLNTVWFLLLGILIAGYAVLDGFDLGVGVLHLFAKDKKERRIHMNAIGPVWGAIFGVRGIALTGPATNVVMFISNTVASISVLIGLCFVIYGARRT